MQRSEHAVARRILPLLAVALMLAACTTTGPRPVFTLPPSLPQGLPVVVEPGMFRYHAASQRVSPNTLYAYEAFTHCGFTPLTFDFDGSYWVVLGPRGDGQGNPPAGIGNSSDVGTIELVGENNAIFTSQGGQKVQLQRAAVEAEAFGCD